MELGMIIAECPYCGAHRYSWSEDDAIYKLSKHRCSATLANKQVVDILNRALDKAKNSSCL